jgi:hypothetical protein
MGVSRYEYNVGDQPSMQSGDVNMVEDQWVMPRREELMFAIAHLHTGERGVCVIDARLVLTEICLCHACSCCQINNIEDGDATVGAINLTASVQKAGSGRFEPVCTRYRSSS